MSNRNRNQRRARNRRRGPQQQRNVPRSMAPHVERLANELVRSTNPFAPGANKAKVRSDGCCATVSMSIPDSFTVSTSTDAGNSDKYMCKRFSPNMAQQIVTCTMNNGTVSAVAPANSRWYSSIGDAETYRIVSAACRIVYRGPPLTAKGSFRIWRLCATDIAQASGGAWPEAYGEVAHEYYDFSCSELMKGVTVLLFRMDPQSKNFQDIPTLLNHECWQGFQIMGTGLDDDATLMVDWREVIEFTPHCNTLASQVATPGLPQAPQIEKAASKLSETSGVFTGAVNDVLKKHKHKAGNIATQFINKAASAIGGQVVKQGLDWAAGSALDAIETFGAEALGGLLLL